MGKSHEHLSPATANILTEISNLSSPETLGSGRRPRKNRSSSRVWIILKRREVRFDGVNPRTALSGFPALFKLRNRFHKSNIQGMRLERPRLQFRMKLHSHEKRVVF